MDGIATVTQEAHVEFLTCYASWTSEELVVGNTLVERRWKIDEGLLYPSSLFDKVAMMEWLKESSTQPAPCPPIKLPHEQRTLRFTSQTGQAGPTEEPSLRIEGTVQGNTATFRFQLRIFPVSTGVTIQLTDYTVTTDTCDSASAATVITDNPTGVELADNSRNDEKAIRCDCLESFRCAAPHTRLIQYTLQDQTDCHNELLFTREWLLHPSESLQLAGCVFVIEDTLHQNGLILLKQAPLPHARPQQSADDLHVEAGERITWLNHGTHETVHTGYQYAMLTYSGGRFGRIEALQRYQRQHRIFRPDDDIVFLSNTWGDRSQDGRIEESFLLQEIDACARLGVDVVQIDDGWQTGRTANSVDGNGVWNGFWAANASFWEANPTRLPHGLTPIVERAKAHGINVGLWFAPDSSDDFANWRRDADTLLNLYRDHGIRYFKIDGVKAFTKMAEKHLHAFFDTVLTDSHGDVMFDLDVTAEVRPGYFGLLHTGPLFVENRYTDWHRYWPHQTLRNLWQLSQVVDPRRLRIEMLNNTRNQQLYTDDPLAPVTYRPAYLFATTMFANPLGWFEASNLPDSYIDEVANLVGVWKQHRTAIFTGQMYPIGAVPDGTAWTGFASVAPDKQSGYLLIFREVNEQGTAVISLPMLQGTYDCSILGGHGNATLADGALNVSVPSEKDFAFIKFSIA